MSLVGGWKGLQIEGVRFEPLTDAVFLESVKADRLVYGTQESGTVAVALQQRVHAAAGAARRRDRERSAAAGHLARCRDRDSRRRSGRASRHGEAAGASGVWSSTASSPVPPWKSPFDGCGRLRAGWRGARRSARLVLCQRQAGADRALRPWPSDRDYEPKNIDQFVADQRRMCFPLAEFTFWAPDDYMMLVPPAGKDRWWSGQTLAQLSTATIKARIAALHAQGMKALSYTDLRCAFGFRVVELFRQHPEWCDWYTKGTSFSPDEIAIQVREDDNERFDPKEPNKPRFGRMRRVCSHDRQPGGG